MTATPEDFGQLHERFAKILGREPKAAEIKELMTDKDEMGLSYHDPLLVQLMAFKRERIALAELFRTHQDQLERQMADLRDHVLRQAEAALVAQTTEAVQAAKEQMQAELKRLVDLQRTVLTAEVSIATEKAVKEKFKETWIREWQTEFTRDWKEQIHPAYSRLRDSLEAARRVNWLWVVASLLVSFLAGTSLTLWWATKRIPAPNELPNQTTPAKPLPPARK